MKKTRRYLDEATTLILFSLSSQLKFNQYTTLLLALFLACLALPIPILIFALAPS